MEMGEKNLYQVELCPDGKILIGEMRKKYAIDLAERLMDYAVSVMSLLGELTPLKEFDVVRYQLSKAVTSVGANYEESQACTYSEFRQRIRICLREAREANYWIRLLKRILENKDLYHSNKVKISENLLKLAQESSEIVLIFGSISSKINKRLQQ
jgi:four helix bundle protein